MMEMRNALVRHQTYEKEEERRACLPLNDGALRLPEPFDRVAPSGVRHKGGMLVDRDSNVISQRDVIDLQPKNTATEFPLKKIQSSENLDSKKNKKKTEGIAAAPCEEGKPGGKERDGDTNLNVVERPASKQLHLWLKHCYGHRCQKISRIYERKENEAKETN
jgi:hypothetical protein